MRSYKATCVATALALAGATTAIQVDVSSVDSISAAAKTIVSNIVSLYPGQKSGQVPGLFSDPYYFWEGGLAWDSLINYWALTGDDEYNDLVSQALTFQLSDGLNYMPPNQTKSLGNDDQSFWGLAAMTAAEQGFPLPKSNVYNETVKSWEQIAQNVFDTQVARWDTETCGGGLRWQIFTFNVGYTYKNTLSNGNFMQLASRLYSFTGNSTYRDWATKAATWTYKVGLISNGSNAVYDGASVTNNCKSPNHIQWTASAGTYISAYSYLGSNANLPQLLSSALKVFAGKNDIVTEVACSGSGTCNSDQLAFRAIFARALANAKYVNTASNVDTDAIDAVLKASAEGAAAQCSGGSDGTTCGNDWSSSDYDGTKGLGEDLSALEILLANIPRKQGTQTSGGNSTSTGATGTPSGTASGTATPAATGGASVMSQSVVGLLGALAVAIMFG